MNFSALPSTLRVPLIVACALFMENLDATVIVTALPAIGKSLGEDPLRLSMAVSAYLLSLAIFIPLSGWMADRYGARSVFRNAILLFMAGSLACALSQDMVQLVAARALQGVGGAMMVPVGRLVLLRAVPKSELVTAMSWLTIPALIAPILGPPVGGLIVTYASWRWIFLINLPIGALGWWLVSRHVAQQLGEHLPPLDLGGWLVLGAALAGLVLGLENLGRGVLPSHTPVFALIGGALLLGVYVWHARSEATPIMSLKLLRVATFRVSVVGGSLFRIGVGAFTLLLPMMLQLGFGYSALQSGLITFSGAVGALFLKLIAQSVTRRYGFRRLLLGATVINGVALIACGLLRPGVPQGLMLAFLLATGFLRSLEFTCINALTFADVEEGDMSQATSFSSTAQQLSLSLGVSIAAQILHLSLALRGGTQVQNLDFTIAFVAVGLICLAAAWPFRSLGATAGQQVSGHRMAESDQPQRMGQ